ncbi:hypothetical protein ACFS5L_24840 [Streptomyces phyllanthi]|uniref:Membrane-bound hydrophilic protein n=1 Tax=Streptomyces phyllanthi TaxID=1803180 RepID=A0A5N8W1U2_9ACTN|nr:hypothetical protein [Streptomyces phyllanthi]MPY41483.1 hypothetical protein [Streptomyces phyllanthi]
MPAEEETRGTAVGESRARSGPRHALPRKPLLTRLQVPAGKAIAVAAMPTAVLMGMGFTPTLARADDKPSSKNLTVDEYKDCVEALEAAEEADEETTASPSPSTSTSEAASDDGKEEQSSSGDDSSSDDSSGGDSSSDSGSDDKTEPEPSPSTSEPADSSGDDTSTEEPSESSDNVLEQIGDAIKDVFTPDDQETGDTTATPSATPSESAGEDASGADGDTEDKAAEDAKDTAEDTKDTVEKSVEDTAKDVTDAAEDTADKADTAVGDATESASPSPSESPAVDADDCPAATDDESGVEKGIPPLADDPWYLEASSLLLKGADYKGVVKVKTANGTVKEVLKYEISDGSDIGDLHQIVKDEQLGKTYHVQAGKGTTSTIRDGKTVMYTESISGNLLGLIPVTFSPEHPPPLNIPLIYFTNVKVTQAAQFGGTLHVPGMNQYTTD